MKHSLCNTKRKFSTQARYFDREYILCKQHNKNTKTEEQNHKQHKRKRNGYVNGALSTSNEMR